MQGVPLLRSETDADLRFDRVRVASGKGGYFSVDEIQVSVATDS